MIFESPLIARRWRGTIPALLLLLLGQWTLLSHVHEQDSPLPDEICWLCVHAQTDGNAIPVSGTALAVSPCDMPLPLSAYVCPALLSVRPFNPRAPPLA